jgi:hypothetical protein
MQRVSVRPMVFMIAAVAAIVLSPGSALGLSWTTVPTPAPTYATIASNSCVSNSCVNVGTYSSDGGAQFAYASTNTNSTGTQENAKATPNPAGATASQLDGVSCAGLCTAVGMYTSSSGTKLSLAMYRNGSTW